MIRCKSLTLIDLKEDKALMISLHLTSFTSIKMKQQFLAFKVGETGAKSNRGEMQQSQYLAQVMSLGIVIHNVVVQFDNPPFHPKMAGEMLSYRIFSSRN